MHRIFPRRWKAKENYKKYWPYRSKPPVSQIDETVIFQSFVVTYYIRINTNTNIPNVIIQLIISFYEILDEKIVDITGAIAKNLYRCLPPATDDKWFDMEIHDDLIHYKSQTKKIANNVNDPSWYMCIYICTLHTSYIYI